MPVLGDTAVCDAVDVGGDEVDRSTVALTCSASVAEGPGEVAGEAQAADHAVAHDEHLFNLDVQVRNGCAEILRREHWALRPAGWQGAIDEVGRQYGTRVEDIAGVPEGVVAARGQRHCFALRGGN